MSTKTTTLTDTERHTLLRAWPWPEEASGRSFGFSEVAEAVERIVAARVSTTLGMPARMPPTSAPPSPPSPPRSRRHDRPDRAGQAYHYE